MPPGHSTPDPGPAGALAQPRASPRKVFRAYLAMVMGLLSVSGAAMTVSPLLGFSERPSFESFAGAVVLGAIGVAAWAMVAFTRGRGGRAALAWVAFPISLFSLVGMVPLLCMAVMPEILGNMGSPDRVSVERAGPHLRIEFPRLVRRDAINLELDDMQVPVDYFTDHPRRALWEHRIGPRGRSALILDLDGIQADLRIGPVRRIGINHVQSAPQIVDAGGVRFQPQRFLVPGPGVPEKR